METQWASEQASRRCELKDNFGETRDEVGWGGKFDFVVPIRVKVGCTEPQLNHLGQFISLWKKKVTTPDMILTQA
jgi:hypothetical protein